LPGRTVPLHPAVPSYLDTLFPRANGRSLGGGAAEYLYSNTQPTNEYCAQMRIDHRFNGGDTLFARYTFDDGKVDRVPPNKPPVSITKEHSRNQYLTVEHQHLFSPAVLNTFKGGINRSVSLADNVRTIDIPPSLAWLPGEKFGYFTITGVVTEMGGDFRLPRNDYLTNWQLGDTLFWTRGAHAAKFGFQSQLIQFHQNTTSQQGGIVTFPNLAAFLQGQPSNVDFAVPGLIDPIRDYKQWLFGFFAQDDVRMQSTVSLNHGLRYDVILPKYYFFSGSLNPPFTTRTTIVNPPFPNVMANFDPKAPIRAQLQTVNYDLQTPFITQYNAGIQHALPGDWDVFVGYVGSRGRNLLRLGDANLAPETIVNGVKTYLPQLGRRNPNFGPVFQRVTDARSFYDSMQLSVMKRYSRGLRAQ